MSRATERRSPEAAEYRKHYGTARWKRMRAEQLNRQPLCQTHLEQGHTVPATVANHKRPHRGDLALFFDPTNLQSVCKPCHDGPIQKAEVAGVSGAVDPDGWPTDPRHRANRRA